jgi:serine/threonine-protein kinase
MPTPGDPSPYSLLAQDSIAPGVLVGGMIAGKYRVERVLGRGGMGVVVAACHLQLERTVAIKLIRAEYMEDSLAVERLVREARAAASIQSEHVARVLDVGTLESGVPFIVMEYLEGQDLETLLRRDGPLPSIDAVDFLLQASEAIAEAHRNHIVHRDLKPANLFVARQPGGLPCIKVVDFGISKIMNSASAQALTHPSHVVGSLYHMAPEQLSGAPVDARTDVWALGVLLFEMLTGRQPFREGAWPAVCAQVLFESAPDLAPLSRELPEELQAVIRKCLCRSPEDRFANVAELAVALMPFGSRSARNSLERIVRLATSTGSLAAESLSPVTPRVVGRPGTSESGPPPIVPRSRDGGGSSDSPVSSDPVPRARRKNWQALGAVAGTVVLLVLTVRFWENQPPRAPATNVRRLSPASAEPPPALAPHPTVSDAPVKDGSAPAGNASVPFRPPKTAEPAPGAAASPTGPGAAAPLPPAPRQQSKTGSAAAPASAQLAPPAVDRGPARARSSTSEASPPPVLPPASAAEAKGTASSESGTGAVPGVTERGGDSSPGAPPSSPAGSEKPAAPRPNLNQSTPKGSAWDLSDLRYE